MIAEQRLEYPDGDQKYDQRADHAISHLPGMCGTDEDAVELERPDRQEWG